MKRRIFRFIAILSLLLCAATFALWMESYSTKVNKPFQFCFEGRCWEFSWLNGSFTFDDQPQSDLDAAEVMQLQTQANQAAERLDDANLKLRELDDAGLPSGAQKETAAKVLRELRSIELKIDDVAGSQPGSSIPLLWVSSHSLSMPTVVVALGVLPFLWIVSAARTRLRRRRRTARFLCPCCGYDLRATSERCPECGSAAGSQRAGIAPPTGTDCTVMR